MATATSPMSRGQFLLTAVLSAVGFPLVILLAAGNWRWLEGWIFALWFDVMVLFNIVYLYVKDPALLAERSKAPGSDNQQRWDAYLLSALYVLSCAWLVIMPLDAERFGWSPTFPVWLKLLGGLLLLPALYLIERATIDNTYLSTRVRIQSDRKQRVISSGVYSLVRHPLYLGCFLMMVGAPLLLGSITGLIISLIGTLAVAVRIIGEEKLLTEELDGYAAYKQQVRYRLIPFVW